MKKVSYRRFYLYIWNYIKRFTFGELLRIIEN